MVIRKDRIFWITLPILALIGMSFPFIITLPFGPGLGTDGARYLSSAYNFLQGQGFIDYHARPLTQFPPVYPLLIAAASFMSGSDVFIAVRYLNILLLGIAIILAGLLLKKLFPSKLAYSIAAGIFLATSPSLIRIAANILSDILFLDLVLAFLLIAPKKEEDFSPCRIFLFTLIAIIAPLTRYVGLSLIIAGSLLLIIRNWNRGVFRALLSAGVFGGLSSLPILSWVYFHNYLKTGITFGVHTPPNYFGNLEITIEKAVHWFLPYSVTDRLPPLLVLAGLLAVLLLTNRQTDWRKFLTDLIDSNFLPIILFLAAYFPILIFKASYWELRWPFMDRIHIIILPCILAIGFLMIENLLPLPIRHVKRTWLHTAGVLIFLFWLAYPINNIQKAVRVGYTDGETSEYNLYNTRTQNESGLREYIQSLDLTAMNKVYSNYEALAWLYSRHIILKLPQGTSDQKKPAPSSVLAQYPDWPGADGTGYVIWIKNLGFKEYVLAPIDLSSRAEFKSLFTSETGDVYLMTPK